MDSHELARVGDLWRMNQDYGLSAAYNLQLNTQKNSLRRLNSPNSRMYLKLIGLDVLLLHVTWASTMIPILKIAKKRYDTKSSTFKGRLMLGVCSYVFASDTRDLFLTNVMYQ